MAKSRRQKSVTRSKFISSRELARSRSILNEPVIFVHDRRRAFSDRLRRHNQLLRRENYKRFLQVHAPKRAARKAFHQKLARVVGKEAYHQMHDCKKEFSKLLSWRASRGNGQRKRSKRELHQSRQNFMRRDC